MGFTASNLGTAELRALGEQHAGYIFLTFATAEDAKRAMVLAKMNFNPFFYEKNENGPFVDLLRDDFHMDFDEEFQMRQIGKSVIADRQHDRDIKELRERVLAQEK